MKKYIFIISLFIYTISFSQQDQLKQYVSEIKASDLKTHVQYLASDKLEGRETGEKGQKEAANYIAKHFGSLGLHGNENNEYEDIYFQELNFVKRKSSFALFHLSKGFLHNYKHFIYAGYRSDTLKPVKTEFYYLPDSIMHIYPGIPTKNSVFCFYADTIKTGLERALNLSKTTDARSFMLVIPMKDFKRLKKTYNCIKGTKLITEDETGKQEEFSFFCRKSSMLNNKLETGLLKYCREHPEIEIYLMPRETFQSFVGKSKLKLELKGLSKTIIQWVKIEGGFTPELTHFTSENVLGYVEGTSKKDETVIIGAHYDHLGKNKNKIFNGADDNASGTSAIMELAQAFSEASKNGYKPKRSILFVAFTGEEKGLYGSEGYVRDPLFPLNKTQVMFNLDMIGRVDKKHKGKADYVYMSGKGKKTRKMRRNIKKIAKDQINIKTDRTPGLKERFLMKYGSDHFRFKKRDVPVLVFSTGDHKDYHKPSDTAEKLDYEKMEKITRLVFLSIAEIAEWE